MATTNQVSFVLSRFEWNPRHGLVVAGAWTGVDESAVADARLILYGPNSTHTLQPVRGVFRIPNWSATFSLEDGPTSFESAELELGSTLIVDLPVSNLQRPRNRFARRPLTVHQVEQRASDSDDPAIDADLLAVHAAMVAAQDEAAEARDHLARFQAEAESARELAARELARRESDAERAQEAMESLRRLAGDALQRERDATSRVSAELDASEATASTLQTEIAQLREQTTAAVADRDEAVEQLRLKQEEVKSLRSTLDQHDRNAREQSELARLELEQAREELQRAATEAERLRRKFSALRDVLDQASS